MGGSSVCISGPTSESQISAVSTPVEMRNLKFRNVWSFFFRAQVVEEALRKDRDCSAEKEECGALWRRPHPDSPLTFCIEFFARRLDRRCHILRYFIIFHIFEYRAVLSLADKAQATLLTRYQTLSGLHSHHSLQLLTPSYSQMQIHILEVP